VPHYRLPIPWFFLFQNFRRIEFSLCSNFQELKDFWEEICASSFWIWRFLGILIRWKELDPFSKPSCSNFSRNRNFRTANFSIILRQNSEQSRVGTSKNCLEIEFGTWCAKFAPSSQKGIQFLKLYFFNWRKIDWKDTQERKDFRFREFSARSRQTLSGIFKQIFKRKSPRFLFGYTPSSGISWVWQWSRRSAKKWLANFVVNVRNERMKSIGCFWPGSISSGKAPVCVAHDWRGSASVTSFGTTLDGRAP
jgi:hypothetical protein